MQKGGVENMQSLTRHINTCEAFHMHTHTETKRENYLVKLY